MKVLYLLEDTSLFGGVKIAMHQAELVAAAGHEVVLASRGERPDWYDLDVEFLVASELAPEQLPAADVVVATFWPTIAKAIAAEGQALHYCQGFEAAYTHNQHEHSAILEAYAQPIPAMALSAHLAWIVRSRFARPAQEVPPALAPVWRARERAAPGEQPRILVLHPFEIDWKGVGCALEAVRLLRSEHDLDPVLVRVSQWPLPAKESAILQADEARIHVTAEEVAEIMRGADLLLAPSWEQEGFGLPVLEAMACGLPVVASAISAFRDYAAGAATLVKPEDPAALAAAAAGLLGDTERWRQRRERGLEAAAAFTEQRTTELAISALQWAASGAWRRG